MEDLDISVSTRREAALIFSHGVYKVAFISRRDARKGLRFIPAECLAEQKWPTGTCVGLLDRKDRLIT